MKLLKITFRSVLAFSFASLIFNTRALAQGEFATFTETGTVICGGAPGSNTTFHGSASCPINLIQWQFPGGTPNSAVGSSPTIRYSAPGTYNVSMIAHTSCGVLTTQKSIQITTAPTLTVTIHGSDHKCMDSAAYCASVSGGLAPYKYSWTVLGGNITNSPDSSCVYATWNNSNNPGTLYLTVTDSLGCTSTDSLLVRVCMPGFCGEDSVMNYARRKDTNFDKEIMAVNDAIQNYIAKHPQLLHPGACNGIGYVIPVVVNIISTTTDPLYQYETTSGLYPDNFIPYNQVESAINTLNYFYTHTGVSSDISAGNPNITFCLAHNPIGIGGWYVDHNSNTEYGVERYINNTPTVINAASTPDMYPASQYAILTAAGQWDPINLKYTGVLPSSDYLNIYVVNNIAGPTCSGTTGYAPTPLGGGVLDGVVIRADAFGDNSNVNYPGPYVLAPDPVSIYGNSCVYSDPLVNFQYGHVLCHEVGHYLDVMHPFQPDPGNIPCSDPNTSACASLGCLYVPGWNATYCQNHGDFCCDMNPTPVPGVTYTGGPPPSNCCSLCGPVQTDAIMYYSTDNISAAFSNDEVSRMQAYLSLYRNNLFSVTNLINTGVMANGCVPNAVYADFTISPGPYCTGTPITVTSVPSPTNSASSYSWDFGCPSCASPSNTSTLPNTTVTYSTPGTYTITLSVNGGACSTTQTVTVNSCTLDSNYRYNAQWYYGQFANIDFSSGSPVGTDKAFYPLQSPVQTLFAPEGGSSYTDAANHTIYSDGNGVWVTNSSSYPVPVNNLSLPLFPTSAIAFTNEWTCSSPPSLSNYGLVTVPDPTTPGGYYIFDAPASQDHNTIPVRYATVAPGPGFAVSAASNLSNGVKFCEGLTAIPHCNGTDYWIIAHTSTDQGQNNFYVYLLSQLGLNITPIISPNFVLPAPGMASIKASADGKHIAFAASDTDAALYDFDASTGAISNERIITPPSGSPGHRNLITGASFNSHAGSSQYVFFNDVTQVYEYDLTPTFVNTIAYAFHGTHDYMQLGPDDNIYLPIVGKTTVDQITGCNTATATITATPPVNYATQVVGYQYNASCLSAPPGYSIYNQSAAPNLIDAIKPLPTTPAISFTYTSCSCVQFSVPCMGGYNYFWDFGCPSCASPSNTSTLYNPPVICYSSPGTYTVTCTLSIPGNPNTILLTQVITIPPAPNITISGPTPTGFICVPAVGNFNYFVPGMGNGATYSWTTSQGTIISGQNTSSILIDWGNASGTATINVTVVAGPCTLTGTYTVTFDPGPTVTISPIQNACNGGGGSATANPSGGYAPYSYSWNTNPAQTNQTATGLTAGTYTVIVADNNGCTGTASVTITALSGPTVSAVVNNNVSCNGGCNGQATASASGGSGPYNYSWTPSGGNSAIASNLCAGNYTVTVTDVNGCTASTVITITQPPVLSVTIGAVVNVSCNGNCNGQATASASGGSGPYNYAWTPSGGNGTTASNLCAGNYTVTVTDANGCMATATITITQPPVLTATITTTTNVSCNGGNNGSATVTAGGGTIPYTYNWAPGGGTNATSNNLTAGNYTVTVKDKNGCTVTATVTITQPNAITATITGQLEACNASDIYSITVSGGVGPYTETWSSTAPSSGSGATAIPGFNPGVGGTITWTVTDANGCTMTFSYAVAPCCATGKFDYVFTGTTNMNTPTVFVGNKIYIGGTFNVNANSVVFNNCDVQLAPGAIINVNPTDVLTIVECSHLHAACGAMWQGINVNPTATLNITNSESLIEDAIVAVNVINAGASLGIINLGTSYFNKNYQNIVIGTCTVPFTGSIIQGNAFTCRDFSTFNFCGVPPANVSTWSAYPTTTLLPPNAGIRTYQGIDLQAVNNIDINFAAFFDNMEYGIYSFHSNFSAEDNTFQNISSANNQAAIYCEGTSPGNSVTVGGYGVNDPNTFTNCVNGVYAHQFITTFNVIQNSFTTISNVAIRDRRSFFKGSTFNAIINTIAQAKVGIAGTMNRNITAIINYNKITYFLPCALGTYGIYINDIQPNALYTVYANNPIQVPNDGIYVNGVNAANIQQNTIVSGDFFFCRFGHAGTGITLTNSSNCVILENMVTTPGNDPVYNGIYSAASPNTNISCNTVNNSQRQIWVAGASSTGTNISQNKMFAGTNPAPTGININGAAVLTIGSASNSAQNFFNGSFGCRTNDVGFPSLYFFTAPNNIGNAQAPDFGTGTCAYPIIITAPQHIIGCPPPPPPPPSIVKLKRPQGGYRIVNDTVIKLRDIGLSRILWANPELLADGDWNAYNDSIKNTSLGQLLEIDTLLYNTSAAVLTTTLAKLNSISPQGNVEANMKFAAQMSIMSSLNDSLSASQMNNLRILANKCPFEDGQGVYEARAILSLYDSAETIYNELDCGDFSKGVVLDNEDISGAPTLVKVYPNPANTMLNIEVQLQEGEVAHVCLYSSLGQLVQCQELHETLTNLSISNLPSGIYLYRITDDKGNLLKADKQMIVH